MSSGHPGGSGRNQSRSRGQWSFLHCTSQGGAWPEASRQDQQDLCPWGEQRSRAIVRAADNEDEARDLAGQIRQKAPRDATVHAGHAPVMVPYIGM